MVARSWHVKYVSIVPNSNYTPTLSFCCESNGKQHDLQSQYQFLHRVTQAIYTILFQNQNVFCQK